MVPLAFSTSHILLEMLGWEMLMLEWNMLEDISDDQICCTRRLSSFAIQLLGSLQC